MSHDVTGFLNNATNLFGSGLVRANGGALSSAFNAFGSSNSVTAGPGFLAVAGALGQSVATVTQAPFGININGAAIPAAASANKAAKRNHRKPTGTSGTRASHASASGRAHSGRG